MLLKSKDGSEFELNLLGYEDPIKERDWFIVLIRVITPKESWTTTHPCLQVKEVQWIHKWFNNIAEGKDVEPALEFIEPNLEFVIRERNSNLATIRIYFRAECRPQWALKLSGDQVDIWVDLILEPDDLKSATEDIKNQFEAITRVPIV